MSTSKRARVCVRAWLCKLNFMFDGSELRFLRDRPIDFASLTQAHTITSQFEFRLGAFASVLHSHLRFF